MRRGQSVLLAVLITVGTVSPAYAQAALQGSATAVAGVSVDEVIARLLSFDRNRDGKVGRVELVERMQALVARGDIDGDGALDKAEIRALVAPRARVTARGAPVAGARYGFADQIRQIETSSRSRVEGAIDDQKLDPLTRERALAIADAYIEAVETTASDDLLQSMERILTPEQLVNFKEWHRGESVLVPDLGGSGPSFVVRRIDLDSVIHRYRLPSPQGQRARVAVEDYKARIRLDQLQTELLDQLSPILGAEELGNLRAALDRRPIVAIGETTASPPLPP